MKRTLILATISLLVCSTASALLGSAGKSAQTTTPAPKPPTASNPAVKPPKASRSSRAQTPTTINLTAHDMQILFQDLPAGKQKQIAADPKERKKFVANVKELLAIAHVAEEEGYAQRPEIQTELLLRQDIFLNSEYSKKYFPLMVTADEIAAYHLAHPKGFDEYLRTNDGIQQQAMGVKRNELKKYWAKLKVVAQRARAEGLDRGDLPRLLWLLDRSNTLESAYSSEFRKNAHKRVTPADLNRYYQDHPADFEEVRVRFILIRVSPVPGEEAPDANDDEDTGDGKHKNPAETQQMPTKEEAREKAQLLLERIQRGEDFATLARENSDDPGAKDIGELGFLRRDNFLPVFEEIAFAMKPGDVSDVVETPFAFHIIKVEERRTAPSPATDQKARDEITRYLVNEKLEARIAEIVDKSPVVVPEDFDTTPKPASR